MFADAAARTARDENGATAAEFALILPLFVMMVVSVLQFGWGQHCAGDVRFALEQASRSLLLDPSMTDTALTELVMNRLEPATAAEVTVSVERQSGAGGSIARLTGVYQHEIGIPNLAAFPFRYSRTVVTPLTAP